MAVLGLRFCARTFSSCGERGPLFIAVRGPLTIAASPVAEHRLQMRRLSSCGSRAQPLRGMWDLPRPGLEPVSPALAGGFSTTAPPGKPSDAFYILPLFLPMYANSWALPLSVDSPPWFRFSSGLQSSRHCAVDGIGLLHPVGGQSRRAECEDTGQESRTVNKPNVSEFQGNHSKDLQSWRCCNHTSSPGGHS